MKKLKKSQYYGIGLLVLMLVVFWAVFKVLAPTTFGSPEKLATYMKSALIYAVGGCLAFTSLKTLIIPISRKALRSFGGVGIFP